MKLYWTYSQCLPCNTADAKKRLFANSVLMRPDLRNAPSAGGILQSSRLRSVSFRAKRYLQAINRSYWAIEAYLYEQGDISVKILISPLHGHDLIVINYFLWHKFLLLAFWFKIRKPFFFKIWCNIFPHVLACTYKFFTYGLWPNIVFWFIFFDNFFNGKR